jgi:DNA-damage-inducible protein J
MSSITVRVDDNTKQRFDRICEDIGLTPTIAINTFIRAVLRESAIPFPLKTSDSYSQQEWLKTALLRKGVPIETLDANEHGSIIIDKEKHPDLHDWAVNG